MEELRNGHDYLVVVDGQIRKITCLETTQMCYKIKWELGATVWVYKSDFKVEFPNAPKYTIIEIIQ